MTNPTQPLDLERAEKRLSEVAAALAHLSCGMALGAAYGHARSPEKVLAGDLRNLLDALSSERAARVEAEGERDRWKALAEHHFDHMRAALDLSYALRYPADPTLLDMIADEITCGDGCENAWREYDTNATGCTKSDSADGCAWEKAQALRDHAKAIRDQAWLLAFSPPSPALAAEAHASALQAEHVAYEHAHETAVELGFPSLTEALEALSALQGEVDGLREAVMRLTTRIRSAFLSQEHDVKVNGAAHPGLLEPMRDILRDIHGEALAALSQDQGGR